MKRKNLAIGCGLLAVLTGLVAFVGVVLLARGCASCATGGPYALYGTAQQAASSDPAVAEALGGIVEVSGMPGGNVSYVNGEGHADISVFIDGVDRDGEYVLVAVKEHGDSEWSITEAKLVFDDGTVKPLDIPATSP